MFAVEKLFAIGAFDVLEKKYCSISQQIVKMVTNLIFWSFMILAFVMQSKSIQPPHQEPIWLSPILLQTIVQSPNLFHSMVVL